MRPRVHVLVLVGVIACTNGVVVRGVSAAAIVRGALTGAVVRAAPHTVPSAVVISADGRVEAPAGASEVDGKGAASADMGSVRAAAAGPAPAPAMPAAPAAPLAMASVRAAAADSGVQPGLDGPPTDSRGIAAVERRSATRRYMSSMRGKRTELHSPHKRPFDHVQHIHDLNNGRAVNEISVAEFYQHTSASSLAVLSCSILLCLALDRFVLQKRLNARKLSSSLAMMLIWQIISACFAGYVFFANDATVFTNWVLGYTLEYSFSVDNLFVFGMVFMAAKVPDKLVHTALFRGLLIGLSIRTILFLTIGSIYAVFHVIIYAFAMLLIFSGVGVMWEVYSGEEEEEDTSAFEKVKQQMFNAVRVWPHYDETGSLFVRITDGRLAEPDEEGTWHCTLLVPVIIAVEICDFMFAVDSVSAVLFQLKDFFTCCSCTMFAMIGLRSLFFLVSMLTEAFFLVKVGIGFNLVFIGVELAIRPLYDMPPYMTVVVVAIVLLFSVIASLIFAKHSSIHAHLTDEDDDERSKKAKNAAHNPNEPGSGSD